MPTLDLSSAKGLRVAGVDALALRVGNSLVWQAPLTVLYVSNFDTGIDGWVAAVPADLVLQTLTSPTPHSGSASLAIQRSTTASLDMRCRRSVSGFVVGRRYRVTASILRVNTTATSALRFGVEGIGDTGTLAPAASTWLTTTYEFTATATTHAIFATATGTGATTTRRIHLDDVRVDLI